MNTVQITHDHFLSKLSDREQSVMGNYNQRVIINNTPPKGRLFSLDFHRNISCNPFYYFHRSSGSRHNLITRLPGLTVIKQYGRGSMKRENSKWQVRKIVWNSSIKFNGNMGKTWCLRRSNVLPSTGWELAF